MSYFQTKNNDGLTMKYNSNTVEQQLLQAHKGKQTYHYSEMKSDLPLEQNAHAKRAPTGETKNEVTPDCNVKRANTRVQKLLLEQNALLK